MKPTVLLVTTYRWFPTARLAVALAHAGSTIEAVCPPGHPIGRTSVVKRTHTYRGLTPLKSIAAAIAGTTPDLLVPGDDLATWHLHRLYDREVSRRDSGSTLPALIARSLGAAEYFPIVDARAKFMEAARAEGVRVPETLVVNDGSELNTWLARVGVPTVLKANGTSGGDGIRIVSSIEDGQRALRDLQAPPLTARAAKRALFDRDRTLVWPSLLRQRPVVNAQSWVKGREATSAVACWKGTVLASLQFEVLQKSRSSGHATVLRRIDHPEMSVAAEKMVRSLKLSGLQGFDFMLEEPSRNAFLIEMNPRPTQVCHLNLGPGSDLPAALISALTGHDPVTAPKVSENNTIVLFPQEWLRDPSSPFLRSGYHDVPWEEPELLRACVRKRSNFGPWIRSRFKRR